MRKKNILPLLLLTTMPFSALYAAAVETGMNVPRPNDVMQVKTVKGQVLDSEGSPLAGVSIKVEGTRQGVVSDVNGNFVLNLPGGQDANLVFSFIGMKTQVVHSSKAGNNGLTVTMKDDATVLGEVVATGMQQVKKCQMTGSASVITAKDIKDQGITSIDRILEGMVAGLNSTTLSGAPGVRSQITIRGANSLNGNTEPLWIVDGLPLQQGVPTNNSGNYAQTIMQDGVGNIMPEDIESIRGQIEQASILLLQLEIPVPAVSRAAEIAHRAGVYVILNPAPACSLPEDIFDCISLIIPNRTEMHMLTGYEPSDAESADAAFKKMHSMGIRDIILTLGSEGCIVDQQDRSERIAIPARKVKAVDTTGAGDTFCGALCVALSEGGNLVEAAEFATCAAALAVQRPGAQESAPCRSDVMSMCGGGRA